MLDNSIEIRGDDQRNHFQSELVGDVQKHQEAMPRRGQKTAGKSEGTDHAGAGGGEEEEERRALSAHVRRCRNVGSLLVLGGILTCIGALITYLGETVTLIDDRNLPPSEDDVTTLVNNSTTPAHQHWEEISGVDPVPITTTDADTDLKIIGPFVLALGVVIALFGVYYTLKMGVISGWKVLPWSEHLGDPMYRDAEVTNPANDKSLIPAPDPISSRLAINSHSPIPEEFPRAMGAGTPMAYIVEIPPGQQRSSGGSPVQYGSLDNYNRGDGGGLNDMIERGYQPLSITQGSMYTTPLQPRYKPSYDTDITITTTDLPIIMTGTVNY